MDCKKFLEPSWKKIKIFAFVYLLFRIISDLVFLEYFSGLSMDGSFKITLVSLVFWIVNPFMGLVYHFIAGVFEGMAGAALNAVLNLLDIVWVYAIASFIDSRLKK